MFIEAAYARPEVMTATEQSGSPTAETSEGVLGSLGINGVQFGFQLLNFLIVIHSKKI